jgi:hypothetical protein
VSYAVFLYKSATGTVQRTPQAISMFGASEEGTQERLMPVNHCSRMFVICLISIQHFVTLWAASLCIQGVFVCQG